MAMDREEIMYLLDNPAYQGRLAGRARVVILAGERRYFVKEIKVMEIDPENTDGSWEAIHIVAEDEKVELF